MPIPVTCSSCSKSFNAPDAGAGKTAKCPTCGGSIQIPFPKPVEEIVEAEVEPEWGFDDDDFDVEPPAALPAQEARKSCPMCGESIQTDAVKCRFCGEIFDPALKKAAKKRHGSADEDLTTGDWILAIICSGIGCIMGIVYLVQGKPKGPKMLGISIVMIVVWNVLRAIIITAVNVQ